MYKTCSILLMGNGSKVVLLSLNERNLEAAMAQVNLTLFIFTLRKVHIESLEQKELIYKLLQ